MTTYTTWTFIFVGIWLLLLNHQLTQQARDLARLTRANQYLTNTLEGVLEGARSTMNLRAYRTLLEEDLTWLRSLPRTLERDHVIVVIEAEIRYVDRRLDAGV